jgi:hypothetical protein
VTRILRIFAVVSILGLGVYLAGFFLYHASALPVIGDGRGGAFATYLLAASLMSIAAWIGSSFASVAGVIAAVAAVQRRQRRWAIVLIGVLALQNAYAFLLSYFPELARPFLPTTFIVAADRPLVGVMLVTPIALLVLVYSFLPTPTSAKPTGEIAQDDAHRHEAPVGWWRTLQRT